MPYLTIRNNRYTQQLNVLWLHSVNVPSVYTQIYILWSAYTWKIANKYHLLDIGLKHSDMKGRKFRFQLLQLVVCENDINNVWHTIRKGLKYNF